VAKILHHFLKQNYPAVVDIYIEAGYVESSVDRQALAKAFADMSSSLYQAESGSISSLFAKVLETTEKFNIKTQPQLLMLQKTMLYAESTVMFLSPQTNIWLQIKPWLSGWMLTHHPVLQFLKNLFKHPTI
jgi:ubiquinone biosynthesis protein